MISGDVAGEVFVENAGTKYRVQTVSDFRKFRDFALSKEGWSEHYRYDSPKLIVESRTDPTTHLTVFRVLREMPTVKPRDLYDNFHDADYRRTWDQNMIDGYNICKLNAHNDVGYYSVKLPWPLANRDFCNMRSWMEFTNGDFVIFNHSVPHANCEVTKKFVRAKSHLTGYFVLPLVEPGSGVRSEDATGSKLIYVSHADMAGSIPKKLTDTVLNQKVPEIMTNIENCSLRYVSWSAKEYPPGHVHTWTTPKMDWECTTSHYPVAEAAAARREALLPASGAATPAVPATPLVTVGGAASSSVGHTTQMANSFQSCMTEGPGGAVLAAGVGVEQNQFENEIAELKRQLLIARSSAARGSSALSLAPVAPADPSDAPEIQRFRAIMNDLALSIDGQFIQEGRIPTTREYMIRVRATIEGMRQTLPPE